jgi:hypothetical protein
VVKIQDVARRKAMKKRDLWNLDVTLAKIIYKYLRAFKLYKRTGVPFEFADDPLQWERILTEMMVAFKLLTEPWGEELSLVEWGRISHGKGLFLKYFEALWD